MRNDMNKRSAYYRFDSYSNTGTVVRCVNQSDDQSRPAGGSVSFAVEGEDFVLIRWQDGPLLQNENGLNGAFVEDVLEACRQRLMFYQDSEFACEENEAAILSIKDAVKMLMERTEKRKLKGVEGTYGR